MKRTRMSLTLILFIFFLTHAGLSLAQTQWVNISGNVTRNGAPVNAMVLANGRYMFTGGSPLGYYNLQIPLDQSGRITLYSFVSGCAPYRELLTPLGSVITWNIQMQGANSTRLPLVDLVDITIPTNNPNRRIISGYISFNGAPVCSIVIANGQNMFTCDGSGEFLLDIPLDGNGNITFYCFISGFSPFRVVFDPDTIVTPILLEPTWLQYSQRLLGEWSYNYTIISSFENIYVLDLIQETTLSDSPNLYNVWGYDQLNDLIIAGWSTLLDAYSLLDPGSVIDRFYVFDFVTDNLVSGCYYQINVDTGDWSQCYILTGYKLADLYKASSFSPMEMLSTSQIEVEEIEMNEARSAQLNDLKPGTDPSIGFDDLAPLVYRDMLDQVSENQ